MPRFLVVVVSACLLGACFFDADYGSGRVTCSDGKCPSGLTCSAGECIPPTRDAAIDGPVDVPTDVPTAALNCVDPGSLGTTGGTAMGSTATRASTIAAMCNGFVMNGPDAVYLVTPGAGAQIQVSISGSYPVNAYVIAPCQVSPATPACLTNSFASAGNPITVTTSFAGQHFVVVDGPNPAQSGDYTLTVTVN